jgi:two-component system chemotaxis response regulator CheY
MSLKQSLTMMVVDDMSTSRGILTQCLDEIGLERYQVENDGQAALSKLLANPVHLVLSDYNMPGMDGLQFLHALRQNQATSRIGFILVTGKPTTEIVSTGQKLGMNNMIKKPFSTQDLKKCIESVVGRL